MTDLNLKTFNKLYPMMIRKYSDLIIDQNASEKDKINSIILKLNALGKLSNDVVRDWNTVYQWAMNDGLTTDVNNKIEDMYAKGKFDTILNTVVTKMGDLTTLTTPQKDTIVNSINSLQSEVTTNTSAIATNTANIATNTTQLAEKAKQSDLTTTDTIAKDAQTKANNPITQIGDNAIPSAKLKQATDADKIKLANLSQEVRDSIAGTTTIGSTPAPGSITPTELANGAVIRSKLGTNYNYAGVLDGTDLDTVTSTGTYITVSATVNMPQDGYTTALLHVMSNDAGTYCTQIYQDIDGKFYSRFRSQNYSGFTGWTKFNKLPLEGKKIVNFGDSIFGNFESPNSVSSYIGYKTGATVYNVGFGGCRMGWHYAPWDAFSMYQLADAINKNNFSMQDQAIANDTSNVLPTYFPTHLNTLKGIDWNTADYITIAYGRNDINSNDIILESSTNLYEVSSYKGALRLSIEKILTVYPHLKFLILAPIYSTADDSKGQRPLDFAQAALDVPKEYNLVALDNYHESGFNKFNTAYYYDDGTHLNQIGRQRLGEKVASQLISRF